LQSTGALSPARAADWFRQLLAGLRAAHEAGVVHRDLKPENVLVSRLEDRSERIKILDFGLAKMRLLEGGETQSLTVAGGILGTIGYMSPEQLSGAEADERSDLFSVGVMAFEAITGRRPFEGRSYAEILNNMLRGQVQLPGNSSEIEALNAVLARCMANDPPARYPSVVALQEALLQALTACSVLTGNASPSGDIATRSLGAGDS
jgi:serine/threonine-protein kinase